MKVETEREKLLSNFEVFEHLKEIQLDNHWQATDKKFKRSFNPDLEAITRDLTSYLSKTQAQTQSTDSLVQAMGKLAQFDLEKIEKLQIINSTPYSLVTLYAIIEECDQRFTEDESNQILEIVQEHFPREEAEEDEEGELEQVDEDVEME